MTSEATFWGAAKALLNEPADRFVALVEATGLDRGRAFRHGDLRACELQGEDLRGFDFSGANLSRANLTGADLSGTFGLESAILDGAIWDETTKWPRPSWADAAGRDAYGSWASFTVTPRDRPSATQRLRFIPPGTFRIGSPDGEDGHLDFENNGTEVTLARGFWLFETPCTQALWTAVLGGKNPSRFKSPDRPVETVSFKQAQRFIKKLNGIKPQLNLSLPSEAQWEYACRAGTTEATYAGPARVKGQDNAAVLSEIAWWSGNSDGGTHPVGLKKPNARGLHDMLGNVWEWCADEWHDDHQGIPLDGTARDSGASAAERVLRGGSWDGEARYVRAACRDGDDPSLRLGNLGFRCARGHLA